MSEELRKKNLLKEMENRQVSGASGVQEPKAGGPSPVLWAAAAILVRSENNHYASIEDEPVIQTGTRKKTPTVENVTNKLIETLGEELQNQTYKHAYL